MDITMEVVPRKSVNVIFKKIENTYILEPMVASAADIESIFNLNETGAVIWEKIDGTKRLRDIIQELQTEYEDEGQLESEAILFVNEMIEAKLLES